MQPLPTTTHDSFVEEVRAILEAETDLEKGEIVEINRWTPDERPSGLVAREDFRGLTVAERFGILHRILDTELGDRSKDVGLIFVFTPEEFADFDEDRNSG